MFSRYQVWARGLVYQDDYPVAVIEQSIADTANSVREHGKAGIRPWKTMGSFKGSDTRPVTTAVVQAQSHYHANPGLTVTGYAFLNDGRLLQLSANLRADGADMCEATAATVIYESRRVGTRLRHDHVCINRDRASLTYRAIIRSALTSLQNQAANAKISYALEQAYALDPSTLGALCAAVGQSACSPLLGGDLHSAPLSF